MGKRGPKKMPTSLKLMRRTARGADKRRNEPHPRVISPCCPRDFPPEAQRIFRRLAPRLVRLGLLTEIDTDSFEMLCLHGGLARKAAIEMFQVGLTDEDEHGVARKNPLNQLVREHSEAFRKYGARFGLSPADMAEIDLGAYANQSIRERLAVNDDDWRFFWNG